jgi:PAS domain S-box-containing protein
MTPAKELREKSLMAARESQKQKVNILMVDDQPAKLLTYEAILGELNENLIKATSGREALDHLLKTDVAVVLMDVSMPEMDGFELADMIRQHPRFQQTAIIFISAVHFTTIDRLRGYARGAVDYLSVPFDPELLRAKVTVFAELHRRNRELEALNAELELRVRERTDELERRTQLVEAVNNELGMRNRELDAIIETAPDIIFSSRTGLDRDYVSERFYEFTGSAHGCAHGLGWLDYVHPEDINVIKSKWESSVQGNMQYESEYRIRGQSGDYRWFRARAVPVRGRDGSIIKWYGTTSDIHDSKVLEQSIRENAASLENTVRERTEALRRMSARLMTLQDEERRRIARELHDSVGQELAAAKMNLDRMAATTPEPSPLMREAADSVHCAIQQVRTMSHLLHPPLLDEVGLESALRWYIEGMTARSGIDVSFSIAPNPFPRLQSGLETAIFRIVQEATTNIYRHSGATKGLVSINCEASTITVRISDNGKGLREDILQLTLPSLGIGIGGMKQRIEELGGILRLTNAAPGALVEAVIPFVPVAPKVSRGDRPPRDNFATKV